jgi:ComEC/Rec2-related protein
MASTPQSFKRRAAVWRRDAPAVQLALAVALGQSLVWLSDEFVCFLALGIFGICLVVGFRRGLGGIGAGIVLGLLTAYVASGPRSHIPAVDDAIVYGTVSDLPRRAVPGEVVFVLASQMGTEVVRLRCRAVDLPWRNAAELEAGDAVWVRGSIAPVDRPRNPFGWQAALWRRDIAGECRARFVSRVMVRNPSVLFSLRSHIRTVVSNQIGDSGGAGLFLSMALGYHDLISLQVERAFQRLGLTHLLVVSGYQVSLMFSFVVFLAHALVQASNIVGRYSRMFANFAAFAVACAYVVCIGSEMSAVRALLAAACITAQLCSERETSFAQRWGVALLGMQLVWPWCVFEIGVILTFAALFGIGLGVRLGRRRPVRTFLYVNAAVWASTSLVLVAWRGNFSPLALVVNLLVAAPWSMLNCTIGLAGLCGLITGLPGARYLLMCISWCNSLLSSVVLYLSESSYSGWELGGYTRVVAVGILAIGVILAARSAARRVIV